MATIIEYDGKRYMFTFSKPETEWISELAKGMGITKEAVVGAAMNKGLCYYVHVFGNHKAVNNIKDQIQDEINKTNDTGEEPDMHYGKH